MIKHIFGLAIILSSLIGKSQTFTHKVGDVIGNQTVISIPILPAGYATVQALIYYPDDYFLPKNAAKKYALCVFSNGTGEGKGWDISILCNQSLPKFIKAGYKPFAIDQKTGDTVKFIVVSPFAANTGYTYTFPQLQYTLPYLLQTYRVDTTCIVFTGLSAGAGAATSMIMGNGFGSSYADTLITKKVSLIMPMAGFGYDQNSSNVILKANLDTMFRRHVGVLAIIGNQDQGYNDLGFKWYAHEDSLYNAPGRYFHKVIPGAHDATVWEAPFNTPISPWDVTGKMSTWTQIWTMTRPTSTPPIIIPPVVIPPVPAIPYPVRIVIKYSDSSCAIIYQHP